MCVKGDGGDGSVSVSTYVEQLRTDLIQQAVDERRSWLESQFKGLLHRKTKNGKPSVVDIARFLEFPIAHPQGGWIGKEDLTPNIIETLIGDLPDSSAAAPAMGFVVALFYHRTFAVYIGISYYINIRVVFSVLLFYDAAGCGRMKVMVMKQFQ